jgi:hypothetical protein
MDDGMVEVVQRVLATQLAGLHHRQYPFDEATAHLAGAAEAPLPPQHRAADQEAIRKVSSLPSAGEKLGVRGAMCRDFNPHPNLSHARRGAFRIASQSSHPRHLHPPLLHQHPHRSPNKYPSRTRAAAGAFARRSRASWRSRKADPYPARRGHLAPRHPRLWQGRRRSRIGRPHCLFFVSKLAQLGRQGAFCPAGKDAFRKCGFAVAVGA